MTKICFWHIGVQILDSVSYDFIIFYTDVDKLRRTYSSRWKNEMTQYVQNGK